MRRRLLLALVILIAGCEQDRQQVAQAEPLETVPSTAKVLTNSNTDSYESDLATWIAQSAAYPADSLQSGEEGDIIVRLVIDRGGSVRSAIIDQSSGHKLLDRAAIEAVQKADPMPPIPESYSKKGELWEFLVPIQFHLK